jgi:hypothetical protein
MAASDSVGLANWQSQPISIALSLSKAGSELNVV